MKYLAFLMPMQFEIQMQWWSILSTHLQFKSSEDLHVTNLAMVASRWLDAAAPRAVLELEIIWYKI